MKTRIKNHGTFIALFIAFSIAFSSVAKANEGFNDTTSVDLKFIGNIQNQPVFQLDFENAAKDEVTITIIDQFGAVLYFDKVKGKSLSRKFQFNMDEMEGDMFRLEVKAKKNDKPEVYEINRNTRIVQETYVSKL